MTFNSKIDRICDLCFGIFGILLGFGMVFVITKEWYSSSILVSILRLLVMASCFGFGAQDVIKSHNLKNANR